MIAVFMAQVGRCAVAALCPTDDDLKAALYEHASEATQALANEYYAQNPQDILFFHPTVIRDIRDVHCGEPSSERQMTINCSLTVIYPSAVYYEVVKLTHGNGKWTM